MKYVMEVKKILSFEGEMNGFRKKQNQLYWFGFVKSGTNNELKSQQ
jgi:hypothetical protein